MKAFFLFIFLAVASQGASYVCVLKSKSNTAVTAPVLANPRVHSEGVLSHYMVQTMDRTNPMTIIGFDTSKLDSRKPYRLDFKAQIGGQTMNFEIRFSKSTGLIVQTYNEISGTNFTYEFMESSSSPPTLSIPSRTGLSSSISCMPN